MVAQPATAYGTARPPRTSPTERLVTLALVIQAYVLAGYASVLEALRPTEFGRAHSQATAVVDPLVTRAPVAGPVMTIGRAILVAVVILIVLGELYATDIVANPTNPNTFTNLTKTFASYGETAYIMVGLGLIALGASVALSFFGGFGGGGR